MKRIYLTGKFKNRYIDLPEDEYELLKDLKLRMCSRGYIYATIEGKTKLVKDPSGKSYRIKPEKQISKEKEIAMRERYKSAIEKVYGTEGIYKIFDHYQAWITVYYGMEFVGNFKTLQKAKAAYRNKYKELFGKDVLSVFD